MQALTAQVRLLPSPLLEHLLRGETGLVAIVADESRYETGPANLWGRTLGSVAYVSVEDLARDTERTLHVIGHLVDHYLGCGGQADGAWLTSGGGVSPALQEAGGRLPRLFELGYGIDETAQDNIRDYFARSLACYCRDRQALSVADPQITRWFRSTLWSEAYWRRSGACTGD